MGTACSCLVRVETATHHEDDRHSVHDSAISRDVDWSTTAVAANSPLSSQMGLPTISVSGIGKQPASSSRRTIASPATVTAASILAVELSPAAAAAFPLDAFEPSMPSAHMPSTVDSATASSHLGDGSVLVQLGSDSATPDLEAMDDDDSQHSLLVYTNPFLSSFQVVHHRVRSSQANDRNRQPSSPRSSFERTELQSPLAPSRDFSW